MTARAVAAALLVASLSACGSTVQVDQPGAGADQGAVSTTGGLGVPSDALGAPVAAPDAGDGTVAGGTTDGTTSGGVPGGQPGAPAVPGDPTSAPDAPTSADPTSSTKPGEPVQVGFIVAKDTGSAAEALGYGGLSSGNGKIQAEAAVDVVNGQGGLGGHPIDPLIIDFDPAQDVAKQYVEACSTLFEDNDVAAVVAVFADDILRSCAQKNGVPMIDGSIAMPAATLARFPNLVSPATTTVETGAAVLVDGLARRGWFKPSSATEVVRIGLLTHDTAAWDQIESAVSARLKAAGLSLTSTFRMPATDIAAAATTGQSASLRFASSGINRVIAVDSNGFAVSWFSIAASSQGYYPRLGMSSLSNPATEPTVLSPRTLAGSAGVGWSTIYDTSTGNQPATSARTGQCLSAMKAAKEDMSPVVARTAGVLVCEGTFFLADAWKAGTTTLPAFLQGAAALRGSYASVSTFTTDFSRSRAGVNGYRDIAYDSGCDCFRYSGSTQRFSQ